MNRAIDVLPIDEQRYELWIDARGGGGGGPAMNMIHIPLQLSIGENLWSI